MLREQERHSLTINRPWIRLPLWPQALFQAWALPPDPWWTSGLWDGTSFPGWRNKKRFYASICPSVDCPSHLLTLASIYLFIQSMIRAYSHSTTHWNIYPLTTICCLGIKMTTHFISLLCTFIATVSLTSTDLSCPFSSKKTSLWPALFRSPSASALMCRIFPLSSSTWDETKPEKEEDWNK